MIKYEGNVDCARRATTLTTSNRRKIRYVSTHHLKGAKLNSLKRVSIEDVPVVREFPDVFLEELPGMPPDEGYRVSN